MTSWHGSRRCPAAPAAVTPPDTPRPALGGPRPAAVRPGPGGWVCDSASFDSNFTVQARHGCPGPRDRLPPARAGEADHAGRDSGTTMTRLQDKLEVHVDFKFKPQLQVRTASSSQIQVSLSQHDERDHHDD